ncbi:MAG: hypothetical protein HY965_03360 [Ignavibacteriales bacterium]|nr:hypothetical protein [Ignavibacteriales bacterium]
MIEYQPGQEGRYSNQVVAKAITEFAFERGREGSDFLKEAVAKMLSDKVNAKMHRINTLIAQTIHGNVK